jgi:ribosome-binding factor A
MTQRTDRLDELLRQEIGGILAREVKDPRVGFATVTRVETTADLSHATVWVSVIGQKGERVQTVAALEHVMHFVRRELGARLRLRRIPDLHVRLDDSGERGTRLLHLIEELEAGHEVPLDDEAPVGESLPTPVSRLPHQGDTPEEPPSAAEPPTLVRRPRGPRGRRTAGVTPHRAGAPRGSRKPKR